ncbi:MAG: hypothetical protein EPN60_06160 [Nevskiaceae bacterium]|jgi:hypothetical protein|nr:MAG: hypothetical protein EPO48_08955 [Nevskiaceae bacterium]TAM29284.1 MAG: hypothetical protein EPN60_06160 [Nevskiaceae bacterium]
MNDLSRSLSELPELPPPPGGWARLSQRLDAREALRRRGRWAGGLALAASVLLAVLNLPVAPVSPAPAGAAPATAVAGLIQQSQALEQRLAVLKSEAGVWSGALAGNAAGLQRDVALLDVQLSDLAFDPSADQRAAEVLWQRRVSLLNRLVSAHEAPTLTPATMTTTTTAGLGGDTAEAEVLEL